MQKKLLNYQRDDRPWGMFERFTLNENTTVKVITVRAGEAFSLQTHKQRDEFWRILSGSGVVIVGEEKRAVTPGDEFFILSGVAHRAEAGIEDLVFLEIAFGDFNEDDITRLEDKYGRS